jgi:RHS repeat-associated protein
MIPTTIGGVLSAKTAHASSAYETAVLADSPSVYYRLGESSGTTASDDSGNGYDGTYAASGVTYGVAGAIENDTDTAVTFSGASVNGVTEAGSGLPSGHAARSVEAWFKTTGSFGALVSYGNNSGSGSNGWELYESGSTTICMDANPDQVCATTPYVMNDGAWHYAAATYDGNVGIVIYLDGQPIGSGSLSAQPNTTVPDTGLKLGGDGAGGDKLVGSLDETAIYGSELTSSEIGAHWQAGRDWSCPSTPSDVYAGSVLADSPDRFYRVDDSSGEALSDYSGNCNAGAYASYGITYGATGGLPTSPDDSITESGVGGTQVGGVADAGGLPSGHDARTLEAWFKTGSGHPTLLWYGNWNVSTYHVWALLMQNTDEICADDAATLYCGTAPYALTDNYWHQAAITYDGNTGVVIYVDGRKIGTGTLSAQLNTPTTGLPAVIGGDPCSCDVLNGGMDDVAIYPSALSAKRIAAHYLASGNSVSPSGTTPTAAEKLGHNPCFVCWLQGILSGSAADPVDTASGNFSESFADVSIPGRSYPLAVARTYNSQDAATNGPFGYGWTYNYGLSLSCSSQTATITQEDGSQVSFTTSGSCSSGTWTAAAPRYLATLAYSGGTWTFTRQGKDAYTFNSSGQLTSETDLNGYGTSLTYSSGKLDTVTDPAGRSLTFGWTGSNITSVTDANVGGNTRTVSYSYDGNGDLQDVTDVNGGDTHFTYSSHRMTVMKDPVCEAIGAGCPGVQNHYDGNGRVDWQKDQLNRETDFSYSGTPFTVSGGTTTITDPAGNETQDGYQWGVRTFHTAGYGTADAATTYFTYDPDTLALTATMDPNGGVTTYTVDSSGNPLTVTDPLGRVTTNTYNGFNELLTSEDPSGVTTTNTYDGNGNLTSSSRPLSGTGQTQETDYTYGNGTYPGDVTQVTDPNGKDSYFHYDANGYRDQVKDPVGHVTGTVRNDDGWITASYSPKAACTWNSSPPTGCSSTYETTYGYDAPGTSTVNEFGQVGTVTDPLSHTTEYTYDADGRTLTVQDGNGNDNQNAYDLAGELCWTLPGGTSGNDCSSPPTNARVTDFNDDGTVADQKDGKGNAILTYGYNARGQVTSTTDALSNTTSYTLDANGNVLTKVDPGGSCGGSPSGCTTYTYDADNELKTVSYSDSSSEDVTSITYDDLGQRTAMSDGTGDSSWTFDSLHRLTAYTNGNGDTVSYGYTYGGGPSYDLKNQVRSIAYPNSVGTVTQSWNDDGTLASVTDWNSKTTTFGYDSNANQTSQVSPSTANVTDTFGFNAADQMTSVSDSNGSTLFSATYSRDSNGQLASDSSQAANQGSYKYTALNQLCYAGSSSTNACGSPPASSYPYAFDSADNLTTNNGTTQQYNAADQLCWSVSGASANACNSAPAGATTYGYDNKGNRTSTVPSVGSATCDVYDQADRLTNIKTGTGTSCTSPTTVGTYAYDGDGMRESKAVSGTTTQFTWAGTGGALLQQNDGTTVTSFLYGPGGLPVEQIAGSTTSYLHHDQLGSTRLITDSAGATGTATTIIYDPYGTVVTSSGSLTTPLGYTGVYTDTESGLLAATHRYYDPVTAQFLTVDPAIMTTLSPYAYVSGNPLNSTDPTGLDNDYYYSWDMGAARNGGPAATIWWLTHRADYEFPFTIHDLASSYTVHSFGAISDVGGTTSTLCQGQNYAISAGGGSQPIHVDYAGMQGNVAVLQFTALPGHVEGTGSTIRFSSWVSSDGHQHFDVTGHDTYNYDGVPASWPLGFGAGTLTHIADAFAVQSMWNQLATNVNGGSYPGG